MRFAVAELALVLRLFRAALGHQTKRIVLTVLAIAWGTLSIVLLLSFGEGLKRSLAKGCRGMGEGIAVVWPGATTKAWMGLPSGRPIPLKEEDPALLRSRVPEIAALSVEFSRWVPMTVGKKTGAKPRFIQTQFLLETLTLTAIGGLLGFAVTLAILFGFPFLGLDEYVGTPVASPIVVLTTASLLGLIGFVAGYFPARRASLLDPVVALKLS